MKNKCVILFFLSAILSIPSMSLANMTSDNFIIKSSVMSSAGGRMNSPNYKTNSISGQPTPIMLQNNIPISTSYSLFPGYLYTLIPNSCSGNLDADMDVDGNDIFIFLLGYPGSFDIVDLENLAAEFGKEDCY